MPASGPGALAGWSATSTPLWRCIRYRLSGYFTSGGGWCIRGMGCPSVSFIDDIGGRLAASPTNLCFSSSESPLFLRVSPPKQYQQFFLALFRARTLTDNFSYSRASTTKLPRTSPDIIDHGCRRAQDQWDNPFSPSHAYQWRGGSRNLRAMSRGLVTNGRSGPVGRGFRQEDLHAAQSGNYCEAGRRYEIHSNTRTREDKTK